MNNDGPIGVFDSGIGGLSIALRIRELLPNENILYLADSDNAPYGDKPEEFITQRSSSIAEFLLQRNAKVIVVACNTATVSSIQKLRSKFKVPIIGVEPGVKPATITTKNGVIGVLATTQTLQSSSFNDLARCFSREVKIEVQPCPGLVEQVEMLSLDGDVTEALIKKYVSSLLAKGADTIVLGCTHYAFLAPVIRKVAGPNIEILNTELAVAKETARRLDIESLLSSNATAGKNEFWSSGDQSVSLNQFSQLWGQSVHVFKM